MNLPRSAGGTPLLSILALTLSAGAAAEEPILLSTETPAIVETQGMSSVRLEGIDGTISVRAARPGEMRYAARSLDNRREERSLALWQDGRDFVLRPDDSSAPERLLVEIMVPRELSLEIDIVDSRLDISVLSGDLVVRSVRSDIDARGLEGVTRFELEGGTLSTSGTSGTISVGGHDFEARLTRGKGSVTLDVARSVVEISELESDLRADLDESQLTTNGVRQQFRLNADRSALELRGLYGGGELVLDESPLVLSDINGGFTVETDSDVRFRDIQAVLTVNSYGGNVHGSGNAGGCKINTYNAEVALDTIGGPVEVEGDNLQVRLETLKDALTARTSSSSLTVLGAEAAVDITNEFGDVEIAGASGPVTVVNRDGDTRIRELKGSLDLRADGNSVEVGWSAVAGEASRVENASGDVRVSFPEGGAFRFTAEAPHGQIHSDLPEVRISDDGHTASGGSGVPTRRGAGGSAGASIRIEAGADIYVERFVARPPSGPRID
jgi:hypothetical protein